MSSGMSHYEMWQMGTDYSEKHTTSTNYLAEAKGLLQNINTHPQCYITQQKTDVWKQYETKLNREYGRSFCVRKHRLEINTHSVILYNLLQILKKLADIK